MLKALPDRSVHAVITDPPYSSGWRAAAAVAFYAVAHPVSGPARPPA
ncbi:hypothetical protein SAMN05216267_102556 [Actinacidiphila rubida]|uniref:Uncharacterized protein n=1 Tax=Actinacidiphila rubida TaxID=310780 RepID=A0A1H8PDI2_9ACTN|nr:hypothetical protein SAMN05216267_102556 [Actinacidiphila rubida]